MAKMILLVIPQASNIKQNVNFPKNFLFLESNIKL